ncbi:MAG: hypothetical protein AB1486_34255 [Planctomycetota bacterium]
MSWHDQRIFRSTREQRQKIAFQISRYVGMAMGYADVADNIIDYFSEDALYCWPGHPQAGTGAPWRVHFKFADENRLYTRFLRDRLEAVLKVPYSYHEEGKAGAPLLLVPEDKDADAVVFFAEDIRDGDRGLAYELTFRMHDQVFHGWFSLQESG